MSAGPALPPHAQVLQRALACHRSGDLASAKVLYHKILAVSPRDADVLGLLGMAECQSGNLGEGVRLLGQSLDASPDQPETHNNRGAALQQLRRLDEALASFDRALALRPDYAEAHNNRGNVLLELQRPAEALASYDRALALRPDYPEAHNNRGGALRDLRRFEEALACFERALALRPGFPLAHYNRGNALKELGQAERALASYDRALALRPAYPEALYNRGNALNLLGRFQEAVACFDGALALRPDYVEAHNNRATALRDLKRLPESLASCDRALAIDPRHAEAHNNRGNALKDLHRFDEAMESYERALAARPDFADAHWNMALLHLLRGEFAEGWPLFEWRWRRRGAEARRHTQEPLWLGDRPIAGRTLLVHPEQGLGDCMQFCRYALPLLELGAKVLLEAHPRLVPLLSTLHEEIPVYPHGAELPPFDFQCPLMSLPMAFGTRLESIPAPVPYLAASPEKIALWRERLGPRTRPRVGLFWSGNPAQKADKVRSIPLDLLAPLLESSFEFHALQKEIRSSDEEALARFTQVIPHLDDQEDFSDTAGLLEALDLVISVDSSVAHLAGAMGKPVWVLLPHTPDYRWLLDRTDSPWYPTARLFRQDRYDDWEGVIRKVAEQLPAMF